MENLLQFERELSEVKARQAAAEEQHKTIFQRLAAQDKLLESVHRLATSISTLTNKQEDMAEKLGNLCDDMDELKAKPAKRWESVVEKAITVLIGAVVGFLLTKAGL